MRPPCLRSCTSSRASPPGGSTSDRIPRCCARRRSPGASSVAAVGWRVVSCWHAEVMTEAHTDPTRSSIADPDGPDTPGDPTLRAVELTRIGEQRYKATNRRGGVLPVGSGADPDFTPVELLLAALAGCAAVDIDLITGKRTAATTFDMRTTAHKVRDEQGS